MNVNAVGSAFSSTHRATAAIAADGRSVSSGTCNAGRVASGSMATYADRRVALMLAGELRKPCR